MIDEVLKQNEARRAVALKRLDEDKIRIKGFLDYVDGFLRGIEKEEGKIKDIEVTVTYQKCKIEVILKDNREFKVFKYRDRSWFHHTYKKHGIKKWPDSLDEMIETAISYINEPQDPKFGF